MREEEGAAGVAGGVGWGVGGELWGGGVSGAEPSLQKWTECPGLETAGIAAARQEGPAKADGARLDRPVSTEAKRQIAGCLTPRPCPGGVGEGPFGPCRRSGGSPVSMAQLEFLVAFAPRRARPDRDMRLAPGNGSAGQLGLLGS